MQIITDNAQLREQTGLWRNANETIAFVPTMGSLHRGHLKLVKAAKKCCTRVVVSIFVNPMQFNQSSDFANYPRTQDQDIEKLKPLAVDVLYCPNKESIYPAGLEVATKVVVPDLSQIMCGEFRPGHFEGVATVVAKLFNLVLPDTAVFGEKDYQQLVIIKKMAKDLNFPINITGVETERETSGLALSSRNSYLSDTEKEVASQLYKVLQTVSEKVNERCKTDFSKATGFSDLEQEAMGQLERVGFKPEYVQVRRAENLETGNSSHKDLRVFAAAWLGQARLIDNLPISL